MRTLIVLTLEKFLSCLRKTSTLNLTQKFGVGSMGLG